MTRPSNALLISRACSTPEARAARSQQAKASWADPEVRAKRIAALKAAASRSDVKRRRRLAIVLSKREPEARKQARRGLQINCNKSPQFSIDFNGLAHAIQSVRRAPKQAAKQAGVLFAFAAYRASAAAAAIEGGVDAARIANPHVWCGHRIAKLGGVAQYLAVTAFGVPHRLLAESAGLDRRHMRRVCSRMEEARDDEATDALLSRIERRLSH